MPQERGKKRYAKALTWLQEQGPTIIPKRKVPCTIRELTQRESVHLRRSPRTGECFKTSRWAYGMKHPVHTLYTLPCEAKSQRVWENRDQQNTLAERHQTSSNRMGCANTNCSEKRRIAALLHRLIRTECRDQTRFVAHTSYGRNYWLSSRSSGVLHPER